MHRQQMVLFCSRLRFPLMQFPVYGARTCQRSTTCFLASLLYSLTESSDLELCLTAKNTQQQQQQFSFEHNHLTTISSHCITLLLLPSQRFCYFYTQDEYWILLLLFQCTAHFTPHYPTLRSVFTAQGSRGNVDNNFCLS